MWRRTLPRSRKNTLIDATASAMPSVNTYCTTAMTGMNTRLIEIRSRKNSMITARAISPNPKPTTPAVVAATGSTIFGNWICLISRSWETTDVVASLMLAVNHFQGRIADRMNSG